MKRKNGLVFLSLAVVIGLTGCGGNPTTWLMTPGQRAQDEIEAKYYTIIQKPQDQWTDQDFQIVNALKSELENRAKSEKRISAQNAVKPNAYGLGVNADQYGRPHIYREKDGTPLSPIFQDGVKRDGYGLGVHQDQFGRPVYDSRP